MTHAYDKSYLEKARSSLARMLDFAVYELHYNLTDFFDLFLSSGIAKLFEQGDVTTLVGMSGVELAYTVLERSGIQIKRISPMYTMNRSKEYWTGWALAYYQWETALQFSEIVKYVPIEDIVALYDPYHEMDIRQFVDHMNDRIRESKSETNLKHYRIQQGLNQRQLADLSGIPLRTIQQYEQRQKNINKAQGEYLLALAQTLNCEVWQLFERP